MPLHYPQHAVFAEKYGDEKICPPIDLIQGLTDADSFFIFNLGLS